MAVLDLRRYRLQPGESRDVVVPVRCDSVEFGGLEYRAVAPIVDARLRIQPTADGIYLRLRFGCDLEGPCQRCLEPAQLHVDVDATEYHQNATGDEPVDPELTSEYLLAEGLDLESWARDALVLAIPAKVLCREDCAGLCPRCGAALADDPDHDCGGDEPDERWAKLRDIQL